MPMIRKTCNECRVTCWHNPCTSKDREARCTYCGHPPGGNSGSEKRAHAESTRAKQVMRASLLGIREV